MEIWLNKIIPGILRILIFVSAGVFTGSLLNYLGWLSKLTFLARPFQFIGKLPVQCSTSFVTAFASPRAANGILAGSYDQKIITRQEMIIGALANILPNTLSHIRIMAFAIIPLAGYAGIAYVIFQLLLGLTGTFIALISGRLLIKKSANDDIAQETKHDIIPLGMAAKKAFKHLRRVLKRILLITIPLYILIAYLDYFGVFYNLANKLPSRLTDILPPASIAVLAGHITNIVTAASVGADLLKSNSLTAQQLFLTFLIGYAITIPIRATKHSIPSAVGIFPAKDGILIVLLSSGIRLLFTLIAIMLTIYTM